MQGAIRCAGRIDLNSMNFGNHGCGNHNGVPDGYDTYTLQNMLKGKPRDYMCACAGWGHSCEERSGCRYNEVLVNAYTWVDHMPRTIQAVFYPTNGHSSDRNGAIAVHNSFLRDYGLTATEYPLLSFDHNAAAAGHAPFKHEQ